MHRAERAELYRRHRLSSCGCMSRRRKRSRSGGEADERVSAVLTVAAAGVGALRKLSVRGGVDARDEGGTLQTPLHVASASGDIVVAEALLEAGAAVDAQDRAGRTPLCFAAAAGHGALAQALLAHGAALEPPSANNTPLHEAARYSQAGLVRVLCHAGARLDARGALECTPLHVAARRPARPIRDFRDPRVGENPSMDTVEALLEARAPVDLQDSAGQTALHLAVRLGLEEQAGVVRALLEAGADPELRDKPRGAAASGLTPSEAAQEGLRSSESEHRGPLRFIINTQRSEQRRGFAACAEAITAFADAKKLVGALQRLAFVGSLSARLGGGSAAHLLPSDLHTIIGERLRTWAPAVARSEHEEWAWRARQLSLPAHGRGEQPRRQASHAGAAGRDRRPWSGGGGRGSSGGGASKRRRTAGRGRR